MAWKILAVVLFVSLAVGVMVDRAFMGIQTRSIADVRTSGLDGGSVAIEGTVTYAENNRFVVDDNTGKVELSTCPLWYKVVNLHTGDKVTVIGEVMTNPPITRGCDFSLSAYKIFTDDGTIVVRGRPGKPPWIDSPVPYSANEY